MILEVSLKTTEILEGLKFLFHVDFTDIVQYVFLKTSLESFALAYQVVQM